MKTLEDTFSWIVAEGGWGCAETPCGPGSTAEAAAPILRALPSWIRRYRIRSIADIGCGDFHWMKEMDLSGVEYDGYELVRELVLWNRTVHGNSTIRFHRFDATREVPGPADLVMLKDVLIHLPDDLGAQVLANIRESGACFLAATTHPRAPGWRRIAPGEFSPADLEQAPFRLGRPLDQVEVPGKTRKLFALWRIR